jgi:Rrf2 family nitric oxide-sensitive transcriptional repressor
MTLSSLEQVTRFKLDVKVGFGPGREGFMFSQTVEYALRAVMHLAHQAPNARTTDQIATATRVPKAYLSKVLQGLGRAGLVTSQRGIGGGISLAKDAAELTILEVVSAVDPINRIRKCPLGLASHGARLCPLHKRLDDALAMVEEAFGRTTLAEILDEPSESVPLCEFPSLPKA